MIKPTKGNILILIDPPKETTASGIVLVKKNEKEGGNLQRGTIKAVGEECDKLLKRGAVCWYNPYDAYELEIDGEKYAVSKNIGIYAIE